MAESINVRTVRRIDPSIVKIVDSAKQVQLYQFKNGCWEKTDYAGAVHVCTRAAPPYFTLVIVNRLNSKSWLEPILPHLEFQLQPPFLLYRNGLQQQEIFGLWFYDQGECARLADLIETLKAEDREKTERRKAVSRAKKAARAADGQQNDVIRILVDANNEYISKRYRRRRQPDGTGDEADEEDEVDDASDFSSGLDDGLDSDVEDAYESDKEYRSDGLVLFKPHPVRLQAGNANCDLVDQLGPSHGAGANGNFDPSMFSRPPPALPAHRAAPAHGDENILQKLFSNATFELGNGSVQGAQGFGGRIQGNGGGNVVLGAVRRMGLGGNGGGPPIRGPEYTQTKPDIVSVSENVRPRSPQRPSSSVPLMTPEMFGVPENWRPNVSMRSPSPPRPRGRSLLLDDDPKPSNNARYFEESFSLREPAFAAAAVDRDGPTVLGDFRDALVHVIQNNDIFVREIMQVMKEKRRTSERNADQQRRPMPAPIGVVAEDRSNAYALLSEAADVLSSDNNFLRPDWDDY